MRRLVAVFGVGALLGVSLAIVGATGASATNYPPGAATMTLSTNVSAPGGTVGVKATGLLANSLCTLDFQPGNVALGTVTTTSSGTFSTTVTIPSSASPGASSITATCTGANGKQVVLTSTITITSPVPPTTTPSGGLPFTGSNIALPIGLGIALLGAGSFALVYSRRRPRTAGRG